MFNATLIHNGDTIRHRHRLELVVGNINGGRIDAVVQLAQLSAHQSAEFGIERTQRLVHEKGLGSAYDSAAQSDTLPIAAREPTDPALEEMIDSQQSRRFLNAFSDLGSRIILTSQRKADILAYVHVRVERE